MENIFADLKRFCCDLDGVCIRNESAAEEPFLSGNRSQGQDVINSTDDTPGGGFGDVIPSEAVSMIETERATGNLVILDVSTRREHEEWHLENAININFLSLKFREKLERLDKDKTYLVYCKMGGRSKMAQKMMKYIGFREVYNVIGGRHRWQMEKQPLIWPEVGLSKSNFCPIYFMINLFRKLRCAVYRFVAILICVDDPTASDQ